MRRPSLPQFRPPNLSGAAPYAIPYASGLVGIKAWQWSDSPPAATFMELAVVWSALFAGFVVWRLLQPSPVRDMWLVIVCFMAQTASMLYLARVFSDTEFYKPAGMSLGTVMVVYAVWSFLGQRISGRSSQRRGQPAAPIRVVPQQPQVVQRPQGVPAQQSIPRPQTQAS